MSKNGYFLNNALTLFSNDINNNGNKPDSDKQPNCLMAPILTYNKKNPCIRRFSISYGHQDMLSIDDLAFSGLFWIN